MTVEELLHKIEEEIPKSYALDWDNVGLLVGDARQEVNKVYVALDATDEVVAHAVQAKADLLLTHHPLIFGSIKRVTTEDFVGRRILQMVKHDMAYYAMHTNFDVALMSYLAADTLEMDWTDILEETQEGTYIEDEDGDLIPFEEARGIGLVGQFPEPLSLKELAERTKEKFGLSSVKVFGDAAKVVKKVAILPGSGKSNVADALEKGVDVLITGDIDHHTGIDAVAEKLAIIDAGHYGIEHIYIQYMQKLLSRIAPELSVEVEPKQEPFWVI